MKARKSLLSSKSRCVGHHVRTRVRPCNKNHQIIFNSKAFPLISLSLSWEIDVTELHFIFIPRLHSLDRKHEGLAEMLLKQDFFMEKLSRVGGNCFLIHVFFHIIRVSTVCFFIIDLNGTLQSLLTNHLVQLLLLLGLLQLFCCFCSPLSENGKIARKNGLSNEY